MNLENKVKVIAYNKETQKEHIRIMSISQWYVMKKNKKYNYKCLQIE